MFADQHLRDNTYSFYERSRVALSAPDSVHVTCMITTTTNSFCPKEPWELDSDIQRDRKPQPDYRLSCQSISDPLPRSDSSNALAVGGLAGSKFVSVFDLALMLRCHVLPAMKGLTSSTPLHTFFYHRPVVFISSLRMLPHRKLISSTARNVCGGWGVCDKTRTVGEERSRVEVLETLGRIALARCRQGRNGLVGKEVGRQRT